MSVPQPTNPAAVSERAARCGAGLLLAIGLLCLLSSEGGDGHKEQRAALRIDPNTATRAELMLLPDIGPVRADAIVAQRDAAGAGIDAADDLDRVRGIGPRRLEKLNPHVRLGSPSKEQP